MDTISFALRADYAGTTEQDGEDVPTFQGGLLAVGDGDIDLAEALDAGDGTIVVQANDQALADLLRATPVLKEVPTPEGATPISPYERLHVDAVRSVAGLREIKGAASASKERLLPILAAHDELLAAGDLGGATTLAADPWGEGVAPSSSDVAGAGSSDGSPSDEIAVDALSTEQLVAVVENDTATFEHAGHVIVPAAVDELRSRAREGDKSAQAALDDHDLTTEEA